MQSEALERLLTGTRGEAALSATVSQIQVISPDF